MKRSKHALFLKSSKVLFLPTEALNFWSYFLEQSIFWKISEKEICQPIYSQASFFQNLLIQLNVTASVHDVKYIHFFQMYMIWKR